MSTQTSVLDIFGPAATLYHAYCIAGEREHVVEGILSYARDFLALPKGHPDRIEFSFEVLGVDESRLVMETAFKKSIVVGGHTVVVISADVMTREAQNALLKTFEDPRPNTHFFLVVPSAALLIATLRSRVRVIAWPFSVQSLDPESTQEAATFRSLPLGKRLAFVKKMAGDISDGERRRIDAYIFVAALEEIVASENVLDATHAAFLSDTLKFKRPLLGRSASIKMILEHLALSLPPTSRQ